jgi:hypothetical protein
MHDGYSLLRQVAVGSRGQDQISSENGHSHNRTYRLQLVVTAWPGRRTCTRTTEESLACIL